MMVTVKATDPDEGIHQEVKFSIRKITNKASQIFHLDSWMGELTVVGNLDFEEAALYEIEVQAHDGGGLFDRSKIVIVVSNVNDNSPELTITSLVSSIPKGSPPGTVIALLNVQDLDSGENGEVTCSTLSSLPFQARKLLDNYYSLVTDRALDREQVAAYSTTMTATNNGTPPLSTATMISLQILDMNDNSSLFNKTSYTGYITENNLRGVSIFSLRNDNTPHILHPSFPIDGSRGMELALRSSEPELHSGEIRTARYFVDKDVLKQSLVVLVKDNGQPPLSATATVTVVVADSTPEILSDLSSLSAPADLQSSLSLYLVIAVASVSCLFFTFIIVLLALRLRRWRNSQLFNSSGVTFSGVPLSQFVGIDGVRAFLHSYSHVGSLTRDSRKSQLNFPKSNYANTLTSQHACEIKDPILITEELDNNRDQTSIQIS
ncbi:unnamed protein product [Caretta caretta]